MYNGWIYFRIKKVIYGLKQAGLLSNKMLAEILNKEGYYQAKHTLGLWPHKTTEISFTLVVDDFRVKYVKKEDMHHLEKVLVSVYPCKSDWTGNQYIGVHLKWDYKKCTLRTSIPGYVRKA